MSDERKGGFDRQDWIERFSSVFQSLGWAPYQAECLAVAGWDEAEEDFGPYEAAETELAYMREGG